MPRTSVSLVTIDDVVCKQCSRCKIVKPLDEFGPLLGRGLGNRNSRCKPCVRAVNAEFDSRPERKAKQKQGDHDRHFSPHAVFDRALRQAEKEAPFRDRAIATGIEFITRKEALLSGSVTYFVGVICPKGHLAQRCTASRGCQSCRIDINAEFHTANRDRILARKYSVYHADPERARRISRAWRTANRGKTRAASRRWQERHPEQNRVARRNTYNNRKGVVGRHTAADIQEIWRLQRGRCAYCPSKLDRVRMQVDHIVPIKRGGSNWRRNLQLLCAPCNQTKNARDPIEFAQSLGRLL